jgi:hypothetical protein
MTCLHGCGPIYLRRWCRSVTNRGSANQYQARSSGARGSGGGNLQRDRTPAGHGLGVDELNSIVQKVRLSTARASAQNARGRLSICCQLPLNNLIYRIKVRSRRLFAPLPAGCLPFCGARLLVPLSPVKSGPVRGFARRAMRRCARRQRASRVRPSCCDPSAETAWPRCRMHVRWRGPVRC